jgi:hypothetical protein
MKGNRIRGFLKLLSGVLPAIALIATGTLQVKANSVQERAVPLVQPSDPAPVSSWVIYLLVGLLVVAVVVVVIVLLSKRRTTARKKPAGLGMPPAMPPPMRPATTTSPGTIPQSSQPVAAVTTAKLLMPDSTEVILSQGIRSMGRHDFERFVPPDKADYISREHFVIGFASGNYYIQDAGSGNGTKLNGREIKGTGSNWLSDGDQINVTCFFKTS